MVFEPLHCFIPVCVSICFSVMFHMELEDLNVFAIWSYMRIKGEVSRK